MHVCDAGLRDRRVDRMQAAENESVHRGGSTRGRTGGKEGYCRGRTRRGGHAHECPTKWGPGGRQRNAEWVKGTPDPLLTLSMASVDPKPPMLHTTPQAPSSSCL